MDGIPNLKWNLFLSYEFQISVKFLKGLGI
jgi:hypothetical protein